MEDLHVSRIISVRSHKGVYKVFLDQDFNLLKKNLSKTNCQFIIDINILKLYKNELSNLLINRKTIVIKPTEENKSIQKIVPIISTLVNNKIRRGDYIVAIGGGIIQDITAFICTVLYRGLNWVFIPTTLLSQADSCIGSKSSVNLGKNKNILGTYNPPKSIFVIPSFLKTLEKKEINSGIGEIIKVHIIDGKKSFTNLSNNFEKILNNYDLLNKYIINSLKIKKKYVEIDEFDSNIRNIFNYGHTFGHAIETATNFKIPHGIAVTIGMDFANFVALSRNMITRKNYDEMHNLLLQNYMGFSHIKISIKKLIEAMKKDKKNTKDNFTLILPKSNNCKIDKYQIKNDASFKKQCQQFLSEIYSN